MPESPLAHRVLRRSGYPLTALLVVAAAGVLLWPLVDDGTRPQQSPSGRPEAARSTESEGDNPFTALNPGNATGQTAAQQGDGPCGTKAAYYRRSGDGIEVTVVYTGFGAVRAIVVPADGEPAAQSYTTSGDPTPHVFKFEDLPSRTVKKVGLTITGGSGEQECELQRK